MNLEKTTIVITVASLVVAACSDPQTDSAPPVAVEKKIPQTQLSKPKPVSQTMVTQKVPAKKKVQPGAITGVDIGRVFTMKQTGSILLVDCRPPIFYRLGHIDGSVNFPLKKYDSALPVMRPKLDQAMKSEKVIVLYCQNTECPDAYSVAKKLAPLGYSVSIYKGGWEEWKQSGF